MTKAQVIKWIGSLASFVVASGAVFIHDQSYRDLALAAAGCALAALHIPRPGDVKAGAQ